MWWLVYNNRFYIFFYMYIFNHMYIFNFFLYVTTDEDKVMSKRFVYLLYYNKS